MLKLATDHAAATTRTGAADRVVESVHLLPVIRTGPREETAAAELLAVCSLAMVRFLAALSWPTEASKP
jgi:hypothetical protein